MEPNARRARSHGRTVGDPTRGWEERASSDQAVQTADLEIPIADERDLPAALEDAMAQSGGTLDRAQFAEDFARNREDELHRAWAAVDRWRVDRNNCVRDRALYKETTRELAGLRLHIKDTVAQRIYRTCCDPEAGTWEWYPKIKAYVDQKRAEYRHVPPALHIRLIRTTDKSPIVEAKKQPEVQEEPVILVLPVPPITLKRKASAAGLSEEATGANDVEHRAKLQRTLATVEAPLAEAQQPRPPPPTAQSNTQRSTSFATQIKGEQEPENNPLSVEPATVSSGGGANQPLSRILFEQKLTESLNSRVVYVAVKPSWFNGFKNRFGIAPFDVKGMGEKVGLPDPFPFQFATQARDLNRQPAMATFREPGENVKHPRQKIRRHVDALKELLQRSRAGRGPMPGCSRRESCLGTEIWRLSKYADDLDSEMKSYVERILAAEAVSEVSNQNAGRRREVEDEARYFALLVSFETLHGLTCFGLR